MESTSEKLEHIEDLMGIIIEGVKRLEQKEVKVPEMTDYTPMMEEINEGLHLLRKQNEGKALQDQISRQVTVASNLLTTIDRQKEMQKELIEGMPRKIRTSVEHRVTDKSRPYLLAFFIMVAVSGISVAVAISMGIRNGELHDNSIKFRMARQMMPKLAIGIDTLYSANPDDAERRVRELESQQLALIRAEQLAKQRRKEAEDAKGEVKKLKSRKKR